MSYTEKQLQEMGQAYHRGQAVHCPECKALVQAFEADVLTSEPQGIDVMFACVRCGSGEWYRSERKPEPWSAAEQTAILESYWQRRYGMCPTDRGRLRFIGSTNMGGPNFVIARCPICGRTADSRENAAQGLSR